MSPKRLFRLMVVLPLVLGLPAGVGAIVFEHRLPEPLRAWTEAEADREPTTGELVLTLAAVAVGLAAVADTVGLLLFWRPARPIGVALAVLGVPLAAAYGPSVSFGWESAVYSFAAMLDGAALALAYCWPPVRVLFEGATAATPSPAA